MNKERLKEMTQDKRFISGIYNYCDQWCERCTQTSRCLNHAMIEEEFTDPETQDIRNEAFWTKLSEIFKDTLDMLKERALSEGIDLDALDTEKIEEEDSSLQETVRSHEIARAANAYADMAENWLEDFGRYFGDGEEVDGGAREQHGIEDALEQGDSLSPPGLFRCCLRGFAGDTKFTEKIYLILKGGRDDKNLRTKKGQRCPLSCAGKRNRARIRGGPH